MITNEKLKKLCEAAAGEVRNMGYMDKTHRDFLLAARDSVPRLIKENKKLEKANKDQAALLESAADTFDRLRTENVELKTINALAGKPITDVQTSTDTVCSARFMGRDELEVENERLRTENEVLNKTVEWEREAREREARRGGYERRK